MAIREIEIPCRRRVVPDGDSHPSTITIRQEVPDEVVVTTLHTSAEELPKEHVSEPEHTGYGHGV